MVTYMNDKKIQSLEDIRAFLEGTVDIEFSIEDKDDRYCWIDVCQDSCHISYAALSLISVTSASGFSGFNHTSPIGFQFLVSRLHRSGLRRFAAS